MAVSSNELKGRGGRVNSAKAREKQLSVRAKKELSVSSIGKAVVLRHLGIDALEELCNVYTGRSKYLTGEGVSEDKRIDVLKDIVSYCYPKVKGVEVSGEVKGSVGVTVVVKHMGYGVKEAVKGKVIDIEAKKVVQDEIVEEIIDRED